MLIQALLPVARDPLELLLHDLGAVPQLLRPLELVGVVEGLGLQALNVRVAFLHSLEFGHLRAVQKILVHPPPAFDDPRHSVLLDVLALQHFLHSIRKLDLGAQPPRSARATNARGGQGGRGEEGQAGGMPERAGREAQGGGGDAEGGGGGQDREGGEQGCRRVGARRGHVGDPRALEAQRGRAPCLWSLSLCLVPLSLNAEGDLGADSDDAAAKERATRGRESIDKASWASHQ
mmetsp:Transcript_33385/g.81379  ORF Transcript_33385/g.81379 Transcript_33385/m.81379 type:complete len:234 (+) Transcript_33385:613-1314(+)